MNAERKHIIGFIKIFSMIALVSLTSNSVFGLGTEEFGDRPIEISCDWYDGVAEVANSPGRVYSRWVNGGEIFCYKSDTKAFNKALKKFADISAPRRRLIIRKEVGIEKSFHGKEISFDWKLEFTGGISRTVLLHRKGMNAKEIYPSIAVFLGSGNIKLGELTIPAGIDVVISQGVKADAKLGKKVEKAEKWKQAAAKWQQFIEPYLEKIRKDDSEPSINCVEIRSELIARYLPQHRIYAIETAKYNRPSLFAVSIEGEITNLSKGRWSTRPDDKYIQIGHPTLLSFLKEQNIIVSDANAAVLVAKLYEDLSTASKAVFSLKFNTDNFRIFDKRLYGSVYHDVDWDYSAEKQENIWLVRKNYVGKKVCLAYDSKLEIVLDEKQRFQDIRKSLW